MFDALHEDFFFLFVSFLITIFINLYGIKYRHEIFLVLLVSLIMFDKMRSVCDDENVLFFDIKPTKPIQYNNMIALFSLDYRANRYETKVNSFSLTTYRFLQYLRRYKNKKKSLLKR